MATNLIDWWHDAGVDCPVSETPHDWLGAIVAKPAVAKRRDVPDIDELSANSARTLDDLVSYLMAGDIAEAGPVAKRVRPSGNPTSDLMILTDCPDPADLECGELLTDPVFARMLEAMGKNRSSVYIASICPGRPVTGRLSEEDLAALTSLAKRHVELVAPKQLWLVGSAASRAILGVDDAAAKGKLHRVNHPDVITKAIATAHPRMFGGSKSRKLAAWAEMQRLMPRDDV